MDKRVSARFDIDAFMKSLSFEIDGERKTAPPWVHGPGWRPEGASNELNQEGEPVGNLESTAPLRAHVMEELEKHRSYIAKFIPHQVGNKKIDPLSEREIEELVEMDNSSEQPKILGDMAEYSVDSRNEKGVSVLMDLPDLIHEDDDVDLERLEDNEKDIDEFQADQEFDDLVDAYGNTKAVRDAQSKKATRDKAKSKKRKRNESDGASDEERDRHSTEPPQKGKPPRKRKKTAKKTKQSSKTGQHAPTRLEISYNTDINSLTRLDIDFNRGFSPESEESFGDDGHNLPTDAQNRNMPG